ncbi:homeotic protein caudal [Teleopsis dalmanni]|uniref:homeotic protein caudal n=1 Tax=Teleopsis dalmanni TaxID=139649 RepID=UPI0018CDD8FE|nr:homeotic protein caudal [Teleopsis dalmanni]
MVSYYNALPYTQKHSAANLPYPGSQSWQWAANYHTTPNHQFDMDRHEMYYNHHMLHSVVTPASDWHSPTSSDNFTQNAPSAHQILHQQSYFNSGGPNGTGGSGSGNGSGSSNSTASGSSSSTTAGPASTNTQLNETASSIGEQHIAEGLPSPPITVSGSEISSPGAPASSSSPHHVTHHSNNNTSPTTANNNNNSSIHNNNNRTSPVKAQYYDWMKKPSYPAQPTPGKTRTKDKYRVVYTDFQRLELEKEYCTSRYITIRRKSELAQALSLSERQVKIWFQNRRAKERKQSKKGNDPTVMSSMQHGDYANLIDAKAKLDPLHLQHSLHSISPMAMSMPPAMNLHHFNSHHHALAVSAAHSHQLHQSPHAPMSASAAAVASVGSLSM